MAKHNKSAMATAFLKGKSYEIENWFKNPRKRNKISEKLIKQGNIPK